MHSLCCISPSLRLLHKSQRFKCLLRRQASFLKTNEIAKPLFCSTSRIICTDSRRQVPAIHKLQSNDSKQSALCCQKPFHIAKIPDNPCLKPFPDECHRIEVLLRTEGGNNVPPRSVFFYDVNLTENSHSTSPFSGVYFYSYEDINSSVYHVKSQQIPDHVDEVLASSSSDDKENNRSLPTEQQLLYVIDRLTKSLIGFFERPQDYTIYHKNIIFQNNIKGVTTKGLNAYVQAMYLLRVYGFVQYAKVKVEILKITHHTEDGSVRVRWRVKGITRSKVLLNLWRLRSISWKQLLEKEEEWLDGFSVFLIGPDGLIYKHICDKMIPKDEMAVSKKMDLKSKLLGLFDLNPRGPAAGSLNALLQCYGHQEHSSPCKKHT